MDLVPHWDYTVSRHPVVYGWCDFLASFAAFWIAWLLLGYPWWIAFMGLVSGAPDWDVLIWIARGEKGRKVFPSRRDSFPHGRSGPLLGHLGVQVVTGRERRRRARTTHPDGRRPSGTPTKEGPWRRSTS